MSREERHTGFAIATPHSITQRDTNDTPRLVSPSSLIYGTLHNTIVPQYGMSHGPSRLTYQAVCLENCKRMDGRDQAAEAERRLADRGADRMRSVGTGQHDAEGEGRFSVFSPSCYVAGPRLSPAGVESRVSTRSTPFNHRRLASRWEIDPGARTLRMPRVDRVGKIRQTS